MVLTMVLVLLLTPLSIFELNEQRVNQIYLNGLAKRIYTINPSDEAFIRGLAVECPMFAGHAVFKARVLHTLFEHKRFDDNVICAPIGEIPFGKIAISKTPDGNEVKIYPNPANSILNIRLANNNKTTIVLRGINGNLLKAIEAIIDTQIDIDDIPNGIIFVEIWSNNQHIDTQKVVIIH